MCGSTFQNANVDNNTEIADPGSVTQSNSLPYHRADQFHQENICEGEIVRDVANTPQSAKGVGSFSVSQELL